MISSDFLSHCSLFTAPRPNPAVPGAAPGPGPGAPGVTMPGPGGQTPHGSFVPGNKQVIIMRTGHLLTYLYQVITTPACRDRHAALMARVDSTVFR